MRVPGDGRGRRRGPISDRRKVRSTAPADRPPQEKSRGVQSKTPTRTQWRSRAALSPIPWHKAYSIYRLIAFEGVPGVGVSVAG